MQRNSAKVCDIATQTQNKQCSWQESFLFPAHCGSFSMSSLQTHERRHWWVSNVTQTHLGKCERKRRKIKTKITEKYTLFYCKLQCIFHVCQMVLETELISIDLFFGSKVDLLLPGFCPITKHTTSIKNRCFIIMGHTFIMNASLITGIKTSNVESIVPTTININYK